MSKGSRMYPINVKHNHDTAGVVFVNTTELVSAKTPKQPEPEAIAATIKQPATAMNIDTDFKAKLKQRFAVLGKKMQKQ